MARLGSSSSAAEDAAGAPADPTVGGLGEEGAGILIETVGGEGIDAEAGFSPGADGGLGSEIPPPPGFTTADGGAGGLITAEGGFGIDVGTPGGLIVAEGTAVGLMVAEGTTAGLIGAEGTTPGLIGTGLGGSGILGTEADGGLGGTTAP